MFDTGCSEHHHGQNNNGGATSRILFPLNLLCCLLALICSHTETVNAVQTHSHSATIIMMCPMPPSRVLHFQCTAVCHTCTHTHIQHNIHTYIHRNHPCLYKDIHKHNHKNPVWNCTHTVSTQACTPIRSHSLNLSITRVKSLSVSKQQFNTLHSLADTRLFLS